MIFSNVIKPTHICNLACKYCYNDDIRRPIMTIDTLERLVAETFAYLRVTQSDAKASFIWHGGEPMVVQCDFYEHAVQFQKSYSGDIEYENSIQTNGTLIDNHWLAFLKENQFRVSISIDGPQAINDKNRIDHGGNGSFDRVVRSIKMVQDAGIPLGLCVVISTNNKANAMEIYDFMAQLKVPFNIIPMNRSGSAIAKYKEIGLESSEFAVPWIEMYDRWFDADEDYVYCSDFVFKTRAILTGNPVDCIGQKSCASSNLSIDPYGDVYPCATLSGDKTWSYGNINKHPLAELMTSPLAISFRNRAVDSKCASCKWQHVCFGGCHARSHKFFGDFNRRDYYCPSLYRIYEHIEAKLRSRLPNMYAQASATGVQSVINITQEEA
jgi:uncharacterized protein